MNQNKNMSRRNLDTEYLFETKRISLLMNGSQDNIIENIRNQ